MIDAPTPFFLAPVLLTQTCVIRVYYSSSAWNLSASRMLEILTPWAAAAACLTQTPSAATSHSFPLRFLFSIAVFTPAF